MARKIRGKFGRTKRLYIFQQQQQQQRTFLLEQWAKWSKIKEISLCSSLIRFYFHNLRFFLNLILLLLLLSSLSISFPSPLLFFFQFFLIIIVILEWKWTIFLCTMKGIYYLGKYSLFPSLLASSLENCWEV